ncbi:MAG TPA: PQQ-binding-like beta-propeller repeat protein [Planctomycetaceae bacterium]|nr:PQQ-binding-like beta-propeller repeat protein [Planctomycetaceae bacterium]
MTSAIRRVSIFVGCLTLLGGSALVAQDWPQWRGPNRDAIANGFRVPQTWPKTLAQKWKVTVGNGVATPALVGDKLYVFARQGDDEVISCLDATTGKEAWSDKYPAKTPSGPAGRFPGPRSSPTVADGKVLTLGVQGTLSCLDAATSKVIWRKTESAAKPPRFFTSCSPIVVDGLCIVQVGNEEKGGIVAYDLATGNEKWNWPGDGTAYASPDLLTVDGVKMIVALTAKSIVGVGVGDGKLLWETPFPVTGMGYNAETPVVGGQTVYISGSLRGMKAYKVEKQGDSYAAKELWSKPEISVQFDTPVLKNGLLFGISSRNYLFCVSAETGEKKWLERVRGDRGFGSVVDVGPVLFALPTGGQLIVFEPTDAKFKQVASYRVADEGTYAYPVASGNRIFVKDLDSVTLWTVD